MLGSAKPKPKSFISFWVCSGCSKQLFSSPRSKVQTSVLGLGVDFVFPCRNNNKNNKNNPHQNLSEFPECLCHSKQKSSQHYLIDCFLYLSERQTFDRVEHQIPNFNRLSKSKNYDILVKDIKPHDPYYNSTNTTLSLAVQSFIFKTPFLINLPL